MKRIDNRQRNLAHRTCGQPRPVAKDVSSKPRKVLVVTGKKRKNITGQSKAI